MPLWPAPALVTIAVILLALYNQEVRDLLITAGVLVVAGLYYALYLRGRNGTHWVMTSPEDEPEHA